MLGRVILAALKVTAAAPLWAAQPEGEDLVLLRNGIELRGSIRELRGRQLSMQVRVGQTRNLGTSARTLPITDIERVLFAERFAAVEAGSLDALELFWDKRRPFLPLPGSEAAEAGLSLARILLASSDASAARKAEGIAREISRRVGDARPVHEARCVEAEALARQGLLDEAQAVLERESAAAAQFGFGSAYRQASARLAWSRLLALEARHPRWKDDPEVLEQHMEWVDAAMAGALQAFLFDPDNAAAASAGLEDAFHYLIHLGREDEASLYAEDVAAFYPDSPAGMRAAHWLNSREDRGSKAEKEVELKQEATE